MRRLRLTTAAALAGAMTLSACETSEEFWDNMAVFSDTLAYELATTCTYQTDYRGATYQQCPNGCAIYPDGYGGTYDICPGDYQASSYRHGRGHGDDRRDRDRDGDRDRGRDRDDRRDRDRDDRRDRD